MANKDTRTFMGTLSFDSGRGNTLRVKFLEVEDDYVCQYCDDEFTLEQIKKSIGGKISTKRVNNMKSS